MNISVKNFIVEHKKDFIYLGVLLLIFISVSIYLGPVFGCCFVDSSREAYVPEVILKGKVLYKDIFILFTPLSYMFNALLYKIFGVKFGVLYFWSYVNAWFVLLGLYLIQRVFLKEFPSFAFTTFLMLYYILGNFFSMVTYIFPYAYAFPYAAMFFQFSVLAFLYYLKTDNKKLLYAAFLLIGFTFANKPEFWLCLVTYFSAMLIKKEKIGRILLSGILMLLPGIVCYGILFLQGLTFADLKQFIVFGIKFFKSPEQMSINAVRIMPAWNVDNFIHIFKDFICFSTFLFVNACYIALIFGKKYSKIIASLLLPAFFIFNSGFFDKLMSIDIEYNLLSWQVQLLIAVIAVKAFKLKTLRDKMLLFLAITGVLSTARNGFFVMYKLQYGIYTLLPILTLWIYFNDMKILNANFKKYVAIAIFAAGFFYSTSMPIEYKRTAALEYKCDKGRIIHSEAGPLANAEEWINQNTDINDEILVLPEGVLLNHITGRASNPKFYQLPPNHIRAYGEKYIVDNLEKHKPDYMIITKSDFWVYGKSFMCKDFGFEICDFVYKNYDLVYDYDYSSVPFKIYRLNNKKKSTSD